jgi:hypothetical protein
MKIAMCLGLLAAAAPAAAVPATVSHEGRLLDGADVPVSGSASVTFRIYGRARANAQWEELWSETHTGVQFTAGHYSVLLGSVEALDESLFDPDDPVYFPERELGFQVGSDTEMTPRLTLGSTVYALRAAVADSLAGFDADDSEFVL